MIKIYLFYFVFSCGLLYFTCSYRRFDYFTLAFFSSTIYFLPGFFGEASYMNGDNIWVNIELTTEAYCVMSLVLFSITFSAWISSFLSNPIRIRVRIDGASVNTLILLILSAIGFLGLILTAGDVVGVGDKDYVMSKLGRWHILMNAASILGFTLSCVLKQKWRSLFFLSFLIFDVYLGFRVSIVIALISVIYIHLNKKGPSRLIVNELQWFFIGGAILFLALLYKGIQSRLMNGAFAEIFDDLQNWEFYKLIVMHSEPFLTQSILNEVILTDFKSESSVLLSIIGQLILFAPELGLDLPSFNDLFQPVLFQDIKYGMAANIWAQMISVDGWISLLIFIIFFILVLTIGNSFSEANSTFLSIVSTPVFVYFAFYIHRNDIAYTINQEKRIIIVIMISLLLSKLSKHLLRQGTH